MIEEKSEQELIEEQVAKEFCDIYNKKYSANFSVRKKLHPPDADMLCQDDISDEEMILEVTLLEDVEGDVKYIKGVGEKPIPKGRAKGILPARCFDFDTLVQLIDSLRDKTLKDYGRNVALVIRQVSSIPWDFRGELEKIRAEMKNLNNPYDKGIWILTIQGDIVRLD